MKQAPPVAFASLLPVAIMASSLASVFGQLLPLDNPGFENSSADWIILEKDSAQPMSKVVADAAHEGQFGLRVDDQDAKLGSSVASQPLPVEGGKTYKVSFFARTKTARRAGVYLRFADGRRAIIDPQKLPFAEISKGGEQWEPYSVVAKAPENATTLSIWIHSWSGAVGMLDFDDFTVEQVENEMGDTADPSAHAVDAAALSSSAAAPARSESKAGKVTEARSKPATIIIKVDDLRTNASGKMPAAWDRFAEMIMQRHLKASIGIICDSLEGDKPAYFQWIKDQKASGIFEFWNHGYDHTQWKEGEKVLHEFQGPSYETQKEHVAKSQALAQEKLGFPLATFGPGYGCTDDSTVRVLQEDADTKIWLYSKPLAAGDKLPEGKVILDRIWQVNIEHPTFVPNFEMFKEGYRKNPTRDYFVIQGHPSHWKEEGWGEFEKILDFLVAEGAIFETPTEYVAKHPKPETVLSANLSGIPPSSTFPNSQE